MLGRQASVIVLGLAAWGLPQAQAFQGAVTATKATGVVYHDENRNGQRDAGEAGIPGVRVSNGREIVPTGADGRYELPVDDETVLFVIKPRDWMTPLDEDNKPKFYYVHKPKGSPPDLKYAGVAPTGPLPASVDFALFKRPEPNQFKALFFGDTQPRNVREVEYMAHDIIEPLIIANKEIGASFGVTLGDVVFNDLSVFEPHNRAIALLGIPWYNVIGNHDINQDAKHDHHSDETWERIFGPSYYAFDHGPVHFLALDDIRWFVDDNGRGRYVGGFGEEQMAFIRNDLAQIPKDQLVVLMMHIPLTGVEDRKELYDLISERPFAMSVSAHTHNQRHVFIDEKDGFKGPKPHHHHINVTVCGSWWRGAPDERGIPHATMNDGAPNGYSVFSFDGHDYKIEFRPASRPKAYQMNIYAPEEVAREKTGETEVLVNVFAGSEKSTVEMRIGEKGEWVRLEHTPVADPAFVATKEREDDLIADAVTVIEADRAREREKAKAEGKADAQPKTKGARPTIELPFMTLPEPNKSPHIWRGTLPANLTPGTHLIQIKTTDQFGQTYTDSRSFRVR